MAPEAEKKEACFINNKNNNNNLSASFWDDTFAFIKDFYLFVQLEAKASVNILLSVQLVLSVTRLFCFLSLLTLLLFMSIQNAVLLGACYCNSIKNQSDNSIFVLSQRTVCVWKTKGDK